VANSAALNNSFAGFSGAVSGLVLTIENSTSTHNGTGVTCVPGATVRLGNNTITDNSTAVGGGGTAQTFKNNDIDVVVAMTPINPQ
jgi:hypothetical protein